MQCRAICNAQAVLGNESLIDRVNTALLQVCWKCFCSCSASFGNFLYFAQDCISGGFFPPSLKNLEEKQSFILKATLYCVAARKENAAPFPSFLFLTRKEQTAALAPEM